MQQDPPIATRDSWKILDPSGPFVPVPYEREVSARQFERIRCGLVPREMEDKWFIYFDEPWLYLHRSWTGLLVYRVKFEPSQRGARISLAEVLDDSKHYKPSSLEYEARLLDFLLRALLLSERIPFPDPEGK